jgi:hypothetical protein
MKAKDSRREGAMATVTIQQNVPIVERNVVLVSEKNKSDWDRFVQESAGVIAWHSYEWADVLRRHHGAEFYPLAVYDGARICGILPLYRTRTLRGQALISVPYFVAGGIAAAEPEVQQALLKKAIEISQRLKIAHITFKQYKLRLDGPLRTDENYYNRELTLSPDITQIWQNISPLNQSKIEESRNHMTVFEYPSSNVSSFFKLLLHEQHAAGVPCEGKAWIKRLFDTGMYKIALLRYEGEVVAGTMVKRFKHTVSFPFSCLRDHTEKASLFAYSLYWQLITRLAAEGITIFHSGRIPTTDLAAEYRLGWGGTKYSYYYQYYGLGEGKTEFSTKRGRKRQLVESVWKRMPVSLARVVGPLVVKQFP